MVFGNVDECSCSSFSHAGVDDGGMISFGDAWVFMDVTADMQEWLFVIEYVSDVFASCMHADVGAVLVAVCGYMRDEDAVFCDFIDDASVIG